MSTSPSRYVTAFGEAGIPTLGLEGGVGCNPRVTFDGKVRNLGPYDLQFDSPLPEDHRANIRSTPDSLRRHWKLGGGSASISGTNVYRGSKRGRRVVTGTAKTSDNPTIVLPRGRRRRRKDIQSKRSERGGGGDG